jgi:hypothetical protein
MKKSPFILFRVLGALLALGLIVGAGAFGYKAGMARGIMQAPAVAKAIEKAAEDGQSARTAGQSKSKAKSAKAQRYVYSV